MKETTSPQFSYFYSALGMVLFASLVALYFTPLKDIALICWNDDDYSHGLILPLVMFYMWWDRREFILKKFTQDSPGNSLGLNIICGILLLIGVGILGLGVASHLSFFS